MFSSLSLYAERVLFPGQPVEAIAQQVNLMIMLVGLAAALSQIFLIGPLVKRFGEQALVIIGSAFLLASAVGTSSGVLALVLVSMIVYALGFGMSWPSLQAIMSRYGSQETAGKRMGMFQSAFSLAFIFAPIMAGALLEAFGPQAIYTNGALLMGVATLLGFVLLHFRVPSSEASAEHVMAGEAAESGGLLSRLHH